MKTVIEMAHEAGIDAALLAVEGEIVCWEAETKHLERFAELIASRVRADAIAQEREACAKVCDNYDDEYDVHTRQTVEGIALQIRARSNT